MGSGYEPYFDPEFETLIERIHAPRVCIDNESCQCHTLVKVDSANRHGILLEMVQVLTDLNLSISKSYISSDGGWLMDVFHVTDQQGNKVNDDNLSRDIELALTGKRASTRRGPRTYKGQVEGQQQVAGEYTALEITATDRPGLLSEILAVLSDMDCAVVAADAWTHNKRAASLIYISDSSTGEPISDEDRLAGIEEQLTNVVVAHCGEGERMRVSLSGASAPRIHTERRLHQLMSASEDYVRDEGSSIDESDGGTTVTIDSWKEKGYSVVTVDSRDRPKLLFDTVCTLTDMQYVVFHATISSRDSKATQEYYIRHMDGCTLESERERAKVEQNLIAAVERRVARGVRLDLCTSSGPGILADISRAFRENGLAVSKAEIATTGKKLIGFFYVTDPSGRQPTAEALECVDKDVGAHLLAVNHSPENAPLWQITKRGHEEGSKFSLGSLLWARLERLSANLASIKS